MTEEELEKLRLSDIKFFAERYSHLFHEIFEKDEESFRVEIENELNLKCKKYVLKDDIIGAAALSVGDRVEFSKQSFNKDNLEMRIHELFHSYNDFKTENGYRMGLRNFESGLILSQIDEGTVEMFAQMICGNNTKNVQMYDGEVEFSRYLMSLVGKDIMIKSTRGNPELLSKVVDTLLETTNFLKDVDDFQMRENALIERKYTNSSLTNNKDRTLSDIALSEIYGKSMVSMLWEKCENKQALYNRLLQTEKEYNYNTSMTIWVNSIKEFHETVTLSEKIKEYLCKEINENDNTPEGILNNELNKYLYDMLTFQEHFLDKEEPKFSQYELTPEDVIYAYKFKSPLDGSQSRMEGRFGIEGPGCHIYSDINPCFRVTEDHLKSIYIQGIDYTELEGKHIDYWAQKLIIDLKEELITSWYYWIKNTLFKNYDEIDFYELIENYKIYLNQKENNIINDLKSSQR